MAFFVGFLAGAVVAFFVVRAAYRGALKRSREWGYGWYETAVQRGVELHAVDDEQAAVDKKLSQLSAEVASLLGQKAELTRILDAHGIVR